MDVLNEEILRLNSEALSIPDHNVGIHAYAHAFLSVASRTHHSLLCIYSGWNITYTSLNRKLVLLSIIQCMIQDGHADVLQQGNNDNVYSDITHNESGVWRHLKLIVDVLSRQGPLFFPREKVISYPL